MISSLLAGLVLASTADAANRAPVVSNVSARQRPGTMFVDITYDVYDADGDRLTITVQISDDDGRTWRVPARTFTGDVGPGVTSGTGKRVVWDAGADVPDVFGTNYRPKVIADDGSGEGVIGQTLTVTLLGGAVMEMIWIQPGTFVMGTTEEQEQVLREEGLWGNEFEIEHPAHEVTITRGFYLGKYEVTQGQWESVMGTRPWVEQSYTQDNPDYPVAGVSWEDAQAFIGKLNDAEGTTVWRLPTEAEWEYACRAGTTTFWSFGDDESRLREYAWYRDNAWNVGEQYAHRVGTKLPNPWGLYDMHGNVWEWVQDWYGIYTANAQVDPMGPGLGSNRVIRSGGFDNNALPLRSAFRHINLPSDRYYTFGVRLLRQGQ
jgi:formylglycine-generating enzyme required for sulfatase activity